MNYDRTVFAVEFAHSGVQKKVALKTLEEGITDFLEFFGEVSFVGKSFYKIIGDGDGLARYRRLIKSAGYEADSRGFISELICKIERANSADPDPVAVGGIALPLPMLVAVLERIMPEDRFIRIKDVNQLERLTNMAVPDSDREPLQEVIERYPVRLSTHTIRQMRFSKAVAYQYLPFVEELDPVGLTNTWIGQFHQGLLEQMYRNRIIFVLNMSCPVYCRFCFRKHKDCRRQPTPTDADVKIAADHIRNSPAVKEMVLTGGDPFMNRKTLARAVEELMEVPHIKTLRLATRSIAYYPHLFFAGDMAWRNYVKEKNLELNQRSKRLEIATHFIHPDEISPQSLEIITDFVKSGMAVYVQTPFLNDCNDEGPELTDLFCRLRGAGAELHYIYIPCSPIQGNSVYWTPISKGLEAAAYLRAHLSDRAMPRICTATPIGKMDWHSSGWAVEQDADENFIWIRSPYTPEYFNDFAPLTKGLDVLRVNEEGTIDVRYMAKIGDPSLLWGSRKPRPSKPAETDRKHLESIQEAVVRDQRIDQSIVPTGSQMLFRIHKTRVEMDPGADELELDYIRENDAVTDVVIAGRKDAVDSLYPIGKLIRSLQDIPHVNAVRLRSFKFAYAPESYTLGALDRLAGLNRLTVANPLRLEIETQFLHTGEIRPEHEKLADALRRHGITVYANTPILSGINDSAEEIHRLAFACRQAGIEFHHLYVAGLPIQLSANGTCPVDVDDVLDMGTTVRREGSGREIPRYIIRTPLGEVDFGMTSRMYDRDGEIRVTLLPYDLDYYRAMWPDFEWPDGVELDSEGRPVIPVPGLKSDTGFMVLSDDTRG